MGALGAPAQTGATRVMLVEDSAVVRGMVRKWLEDVPGIEVVDSAANGQAAIDMVGALKPDIIILDIEMPIMDGLTALPSLLRRAPGAKVILASTLSHRNAEVTLKAMALGATDYIAKPSFARDGNDARKHFQDELVRKVTGLAPANQRPQAAAAAKSAVAQDSWAPMPTAGTVFRFRPVSKVAPRILAIGSSTGGPQALTQVIGDAKAALGKVPVVVVQHMPPTFTALLGEKLARVGGLTGGEARDGDPLLPGHLYVAPGGKHMRIEMRRGTPVVVIYDGPAINHCKPAVDPMFESVAEIFGSAALAAVLTGMGSDGAKGAVKLADKGGTVFAQDEKSSVVWGMPGATAAMGAASGLVPLNEMGGRLSRILASGARS